jgi:hypothetical protein
VLLAGAVAIGAQLLAAGAARAESDHLTGYKAKDLNKVPGGKHTIDNRS